MVTNKYTNNQYNELIVMASRTSPDLYYKKKNLRINAKNYKIILNYSHNSFVTIVIKTVLPLCA